MQIHILLSTGTRTVDLDELKELVRQGVVQPSTLLETGGQRGKAKNVPALKPIFAEVAAQAQAPEPPTFPPFPEPPQIDAPPTFPEFSTFETQQAAPPIVDEDMNAFEGNNAAEPTSSAIPETSTPPASSLLPSVRASSLALQMSARRKTKLIARLKKTGRSGRRWVFALDFVMIAGTLGILAIPFLGPVYVIPYIVSCAVLSCFLHAFFTAIELYAITCEEDDFPLLSQDEPQRF